MEHPVVWECIGIYGHTLVCESSDRAVLCSIGVAASLSHMHMHPVPRRTGTHGAITAHGRHSPGLLDLVWTFGVSGIQYFVFARISEGLLYTALLFGCCY